VRVTILGFGLIGGSIARALARRGAGWAVTAWSRDLSEPRRALREAVVAAVAPDVATAVKDAELVVLAASPTGNLELLDQVAAAASDDVTVTDVSSSQGAIAARAARHPKLHWVGGHPMSGRERRGYGAATADLFEARPWVVLPSPAARPADVQRVRDLAEACGARPLELDAERHDRAVAAVSHLPLLASAALVDAAAASDDWPVARQLAAQGWRDMTRLARGDPALGAGILATNAAAIGGALRAYRAVLDEWQGTLDALTPESDIAPIETRLARTAATAAETA
jgi:prephenate dehydrogenase